MGEGGEIWDEEELEAILQQCEVEAGWRDRVEVQRGEQLAEDWRAWEAEMTMSGIQCPRMEGSTEREAEASGEQVVQCLVPPVAGGRAGSARRVKAEDGTKRRKRRWRPLSVAHVEGQPCVDIEEADGTAELRDGGAREVQEADVAAALPPGGPPDRRRPGLVEGGREVRRREPSQWTL